MRGAGILRRAGRCTELQSHHGCSSSFLKATAAPATAAGGIYVANRSLDSPQLRSLHGSCSRDAWKLAPAQRPSVHPHPGSDASLPEQLRSVMRLLPHSVVVCTSSAPTSSTDPAPSPRGMTMSSFTSLSLSPTPIVTFNIATPSRTLDAVSESGRFVIHVLSGDVAGAKVADWFRRGNAAPLHVFEPGELAKCGCCRVVDAAAPGSTLQTTQDPPLLRGAGVLYAMRCRLLAEPAGGLVRVRDHVIVLAEVVDIIEGLSGDGGGDEGFGLAYADRRYRQLGHRIVSGDE